MADDGRLLLLWSNGIEVRGTNPTDPLDPDSDKDGLTDAQEVKVTKTNPNSTDTDNGFSDDGVEVLIDHTDPTKPEDDKQDSDKDGLPDWIEVTKWGSDRFKADSDGDGLPDGLEDANANGVWDKTAGETSPVLADSDADGLKDGVEDKNLDGKVQKLDGETDPNNPDSDFDGLKDGDEVVKFGTDPLLADTDWDSLGDFEEVVKFKTSPLKVDSDGGGVLDPVEVTDTTDPNVAADDKGKDSDGDGLSDGYELKVTKTSPLDKDTDGDGLSDAEERFPLKDHLTTDPLDADTDDDGLLDGSEGGISFDGDPKNVKGVQADGEYGVGFTTKGDQQWAELERAITDFPMASDGPTARGVRCSPPPVGVTVCGATVVSGPRAGAGPADDGVGGPCRDLAEVADLVAQFQQLAQQRRPQRLARVVEAQDLGLQAPDEILLGAAGHAQPGARRRLEVSAERGERRGEVLPRPLAHPLARRPGVGRLVGQDVAHQVAARRVDLVRDALQFLLHEIGCLGCCTARGGFAQFFASSGAGDVDHLQRLADLVRHGAGHLADRSEALGVVQRLFGLPPLGVVDAEQHDAGDRTTDVGHRRRGNCEQPVAPDSIGHLDRKA